MLTRLPNWQTTLSDCILANAQTPFKYGILDCGTFVANCVRAMTGVDAIASIRGQYSSRKEAFAAVKSICGKATMEAVAEYLTAQLGMPEVPILMAQRGDVVMIHSGRTSSLGIVAMHGTEILVTSKDGLTRLPLTQATRAWRV